MTPIKVSDDRAREILHLATYAHDAGLSVVVVGKDAPKIGTLSLTFPEIAALAQHTIDHRFASALDAQVMNEQRDEIRELQKELADMKARSPQ